MLTKRSIACVLAASLVLLAGARAQESPSAYPSRPIKIVVPFAAGGGSDFVARTVGRVLAETLGKSVIVENKPGAGSSLGADYVLKSNPDGYTLLLVSSSYAVNSAVYTDLPFNSLTDMTPIANLAQGPTIVTVSPSLPVHTLQELIDYAKANPGKITYASSGVGGLVHLETEGFMLETQTKMVHVPYRGSGPAAMDLLAGQVQLFVGDAGSVYPHISAGTLRALAVSGTERLAQLPNVPTLAEAGFTAFDMPIWQGLVAPKNTPDAIVQRLNAELNIIIRRDDVRATLSQQFFVPIGGSSQSFYDLIRTDAERWKTVVKAANIVVR